MKKLFHDLFQKSGFEFDYLYDWTEPKKKDIVDKNQMKSVSLNKTSEKGNDDLEWHLVTKKHRR